MTTKRGFASLTPERRRELASMGGRAVPSEARYFSDKAKARVAGRLGGKRARQKAATEERET